MSNLQMKFAERVQLFKDATQFNKPKRIPILANVWSYKVCDVGYKLSEALYDWDVYEQVMRKFQAKYDFDVYVDTGFRNPMRIPTALGNTNYVIDDVNNSINYSDFCILELEDYELLAKNPEEYIWTRFMPKKYPLLDQSKLTIGMMEFLGFLQYLGKMDAVLRNEYGVPNIAPSVVTMPFEYLLTGMRGIKELSLDLRRNPDKVEAAVASLRRYFNMYDMLLASEQEGSTKDSCFDFLVPMISHSVLNTNQFEKLYWPYLKEIIDYAVAKKKTVLLWALGENSRLYDLLNEIPRGVCSIYLEQDDIFNAKKKIGANLGLFGGFPTNLLSSGSKQACVDYAKKLVDELNTDGGYIFGADKMLTFRRDCNPENLKAINEFVLNYSI